MWRGGHWPSSYAVPRHREPVGRTQSLACGTPTEVMLFLHPPLGGQTHVCNSHQCSGFVSAKRKWKWGEINILYLACCSIQGLTVGWRTMLGLKIHFLVFIFFCSTALESLKRLPAS